MYEGQLIEMKAVAELEEGDEIVVRDAIQLYMKPQQGEKTDIISTPPRSVVTIEEVLDENGSIWLKLVLAKEDAKRMGGRSSAEGWATHWQLGAAGCFDHAVNVKASC